MIDVATIAVTPFHSLTGTSTGAGPFAPQGVDNDDPGSGTGYFIGVDNASFGTLMLRRISNPGLTPTISGNIPIAVSPTAAPITVRHLGNLGGANGQLDGGDDRLTSASIVNGRLWTSQTIGVDDTGQASASATRNGVRWYEIGSLTGTPTVMQSGTLFYERRFARQRRPAQLLGAVDRDLDERAHGHRVQRRGNERVRQRRRRRTVLVRRRRNAARAAAVHDGGGAYNPPGDPGSAVARPALGRRLVHG